MNNSTELKILVLNGPNLNLLGMREPDVYGSETLEDIEKLVRERAARLSGERGVRIDLEFRQSNNEADLIGWVGETPGIFDGILINPAAFTHTSVGLLDAVSAVKATKTSPGVPCMEIHLSNTQAREEFRHTSLTASACIGQITGLQSMSYVLGLEGLVDYVLRTRSGA
jgi:3-dehydroquinate dehydratase-2